MSNITDDDYKHAHDVWRAFNVSNLGEYSDVYLLGDSLQLTDTFLAFRKFMYDTYHLNVTSYVSLPSFTFDAALLHCAIEVELITEVDQYLFLESGLRGGLNGVHHRFSQANHPACDDYDATEDHVFIEFVDITNSYGYCLTQPLPHSKFHWASPADFTSAKILDLDANGTRGYIFSCDLQYPEHLHEAHDCLPLAPVKRKLLCKELSSDYNRMSKQLKMGPDTTTKLIMDLHDKHDYVVHYRTLQLYLKLGQKILKIHRVLSFEQRPWLKSYVEFNTKLRQNAKSDFEKSIYKYLVNSLFGRLLLDSRRFLDLQICTNRKRFLKLVKKDNYKKTDVIQEDFLICHMQKTYARLNQLIHSGFTVLDLSKITMYEFFYFHIQRCFLPANVKVCMLELDTDSFILEIRCPYFAAAVKRDLDKYYDTSNLPSEHELYSTKNMKQIGFFKFENPTSGPIHEFCGLRSKIYSLLFAKDVSLCKGKGVNRSVLKNVLTHADYVRCLFTCSNCEDTCFQFRRVLHEIETVQLQKTTLTPIDNKRYLCNDLIQTHAYGNKNC